VVRTRVRSVASRVVISLAADAGIEYATVFDTILSAAPMASGARIGPRGFWIPVARTELSARLTLGKPETPVALV